MAKANHLPHALGRDALSPGGIAIVVGLHVVAGVAILSYQPTQQMLAEVAPTFVRILTPEVPPPRPIERLTIERPKLTRRLEPPPLLPPQVETPPPPPAETPAPPPPQAIVAPQIAPPSPVAPPPRIEVSAPAAPPPRIEAPAPPPEPAPRVEKAPAAKAPDSPQTTPSPPAPLSVTQPAVKPEYLSNPLQYPLASRRMGEQGKVILRVLVDQSGLPARVEVATSSGYPRLDNAAVATVKQWRFSPARQGEKAISDWVHVPLVFRLE
jgi:periplasmic protein TonB